MDSPETNHQANNTGAQEPPALRLRSAFMKYLGCIGVLMVTMTLIQLFGSPSSLPLMIPVYLCLGVYLSRTVLRNLIEWHPMHNTLQNVASAKIKTVLLWPLSYIFLFLTLGLNKVL